jgi:hypothetical protein
LGYLITTQQKNYNKKNEGMKDEMRYNLWSDFLEEYKEYFVSNDKTWNNNFEKVKKYINKNNKTPSYHSEEKVLGSWISNQQKNYKNKKEGMKDEIRYNLWTEFLKEYSKYFSNFKEEEKEEEIFILKKKKSMKLKETNNKEIKESTENKRKIVKSEISLLHKKYKTMTSANLNQLFIDTPELWNTYHEISAENEKSFPEEEIPRNRIIQLLSQIKTKRTKLVVDMGCGRAEISAHFKDDTRFNFINYDHISSNDTVIACDILNVPLENDLVEICILSLAMWGSNCRKYIDEAHRILESNGKLYIVEATRRWSEKDAMNNTILGEEGDKLKKVLEEAGFKIVHKSVEKFCLFECVK